MLDLISLHRRAYNLAIDHFVNTPRETQLKVVDLRRNIKAEVICEWKSRTYRAEVVGEAVREAFRTRGSIIKKRMKGEQCDFSFKSIKENKQHFIEQRLTKKFIQTNWRTTETIAPESFGKLTTINYDHGRWFINTGVNLTLDNEGSENQGLHCCAIDPGVRTFATVYSNKEVLKLGDQFYGGLIFPELLKLDKLLSRKKLFLNSQRDRSSQFFRDKMRFFMKKVFKIQNKINDLISDLHRRVAYDLVKSYDIILLPKFETSKMASKKIKRRLTNKTTRMMLGLKHYQFQQTLAWMCTKYGKTLVEVNEAFTSKTQSWDGKVNSNLGGAKTIRDPRTNLVVDRDVNGARGIMLRALVVASTTNP